MSKKKNVIVFFTDQQRWDTAGIHGNPLGLTPNLDYAARNGTDFHRAFTPQPVCAPARAALQTGLYPTTCGVYRNGILLSREHKTLADYFNEYGYETGYIGKWHLASNDCKGAVPKDMQGGYKYWLAANTVEMVSEPYKTILYDGEGNERFLPGYRVDAITDAGIRYINENKEKPFFLFMSFLEPHHQNHLDNYPAPDALTKPYTDGYMPPDLAKLVGTAPQHLGGYYGMVKRLDEAYGRVLDALKSLNLTGDTYVLFTSDHGCHFKTRNEEYKRSGHESSIRVPAVIYGGKQNKGIKIQNLVSLIDFPPTLLDLAGIPVPERMQGKTLKPLMERDDAEWEDEIYVQTSEVGNGRALRTRRWKYILRNDERKDIFPNGCCDTYDEVELYDLYADPYELNNLIGMQAYAEVTDYMRSRLLARAESIGEPPIKEIVKFPGRPSGQRKLSIV